MLVFGNCYFAFHWFLHWTYYYYWNNIKWNVTYKRLLNLFYNTWKIMYYIERMPFENSWVGPNLNMIRIDFVKSVIFIQFFENNWFIIACFSIASNTGPLKIVCSFNYLPCYNKIESPNLFELLLLNFAYFQFRRVSYTTACHYLDK